MDFSSQPSNLFITFKEDRVITTRRIEKYTYTDFLATCGGLLGLFLGVSALSIIEFIYYSTLRLYWTMQQWKSENYIQHIDMINIHKLTVRTIISEMDFGVEREYSFDVLTFDIFYEMHVFLC